MQSCIKVRKQNRKGSDSLLGRYIPYRLHPFSVSESYKSPDKLKEFKTSYKWNDLITLGGCPDLYLAGNEKKAQRWSKLRLDRLAYEDRYKSLIKSSCF